MTDESVDIPAVKKWIVAVRPFAYTASALSVLLGLAIAFYAGYEIQWGLFALTLAGVMAFHTATNLLNDCFDLQRGLDKEVYPMSGALVRGWLTRKQILAGAAVAFLIGTACGSALMYYCGKEVLYLGLIGIVLVLGYTLPGFCFKYHALGDPAVFIAFGLLPVFGTYWVQTGHFSWMPLVWSVPLCCYTVGILHANNWRDIEGDRSLKCRTFATLLGQRGSKVYYRLLVLSPYLMVIAGATATFCPVIKHGGPLTSLAVLLSLPLAVKLARVTAESAPEKFMMLDGLTAQLHMAFGVLLTAAFFVGRLILR